MTNGDDGVFADFAHIDRDRERAAYALHEAQAFPPETPEHERARKAYDDLLERSGGWDGMTRQDERLARRYLKVMEANDVDIVAHARSLGLLPTTKES